MDSKKNNEIDETDSIIVTYDSFEEIEDIVTATDKGTLVCCF